MSVPHTAMAETESEIELDCVGNDVRREAVSFISIHWSSLAFAMSLLVNTIL